MDVTSPSIYKSLIHPPSTKPSPKLKSGHTLIAEYSCKSGKGFTIMLNTPIPKTENHYVYGDRLQRVLGQVHEFYSPQKEGDGRLAREISLPLGDEEMLMNEKALVKEVFPKMRQLKQMQSHSYQTSKYPKITLQATWKGSPQIATVRCSYMKQYQPQLFSTYNQTRKKFQDKWKAHIKQGRNDSRKRGARDFIAGEEGKGNGRKMLKVQEFIIQEQQEQYIKQIEQIEESVIWLGDGESIEKGQDSTEDNGREQEQQQEQQLEEQRDEKQEIRGILQQNRVYFTKRNQIGELLSKNRSKLPSILSNQSPSPIITPASAYLPNANSHQPPKLPSHLQKIVKTQYLSNNTKLFQRPIYKVQTTQTTSPIVIEIEDD